MGPSEGGMKQRPESERAESLAEPVLRPTVRPPSPSRSPPPWNDIIPSDSACLLPICESAACVDESPVEDTMLSRTLL